MPLNSSCINFKYFIEENYGYKLSFKLKKLQQYFFLLNFFYFPILVHITALQISSCIFNQILKKSPFYEVRNRKSLQIHLGNGRLFGDYLKRKWHKPRKLRSTQSITVQLVFEVCYSYKVLIFKDT